MAIIGVEQGNDVLGGVPVAVGFCRLCQTVVVYNRHYQSMPMTLGHSTGLARDAFIFYDLETESLWVHGSGEAIEGPLRGACLEQLAGRLTTWQSWKDSYPHTTVVRRRSGQKNAGLVATRHHGLSITIETEPRLYPYAMMWEAKVINDALGGKHNVVVSTPDMWIGAAFERGDRVFCSTTDGIVDESGALWNMLTGTLLTAISVVPWARDRWQVFYPRGSVYSQSDPD